MVNPFFLLVKYRGLLKGFIVSPRRLPPPETGAAVGEKSFFRCQNRRHTRSPVKSRRDFEEGKEGDNPFSRAGLCGIINKNVASLLFILPLAAQSGQFGESRKLIPAVGHRGDFVRRRQQLIHRKSGSCVIKLIFLQSVGKSCILLENISLEMIAAIR